MNLDQTWEAVSRVESTTSGWEHPSMGGRDASQGRICVHRRMLLACAGQ
jgi:hypothetical protein